MKERKGRLGYWDTVTQTLTIRRKMDVKMEPETASLSREKLRKAGTAHNQQTQEEAGKDSPLAPSEQVPAP